MQNKVQSNQLTSSAERSFMIKRITILGILSALAFLCVFAFRIPVQFLTFEPKDTIICIGAFIFGPAAGIIMSLVVSFVEMVTISSTGPIGLIMNVLSTICFVCPAAAIYKKRKTMKSAVIGLAIGTVLMTVMMLLWNYLITPLYLGTPREAVASMLLPLLLPFNLLKAIMNSALTLILYKGVVIGLRKTNLIPANPESSSPKHKIHIGVIITSIIVLITCVLLLLMLNGTI